MMWKKSMWISIIVLIVVIAINFFKNINNRTTSNKKESDIIESKIEVSKDYVMDECLDEWSDYALSKEKEFKEVSTNLNGEDKTYILRDEENVINVYLIDENEKEVLYKVTDISSEYLPKEDIEKLKNGIKVKGIEELNKMLEDFE